jgi:hypothetical protein
MREAFPIRKARKFDRKKDTGYGKESGIPPPGLV